MMNIKRRVSTFLLIVASTSLYFYLIASKDDEVRLRSLTANLPFAVTSSNDKLLAPRDNKLSLPNPTFTAERLSNKSPTPAVTSSDDNVPSSITPSDNSPSFSAVPNEHFINDKSPPLHESSREPVVKEMNNTIKTESPDELPQSVIDRIKTFVFFLGHARSGHSIVGSLMDSHPHMVISHEYDLFRKLSYMSLAPNKTVIFNALWMNAKQTVVKGLRAKYKNKKGYTLFIDGLYQGKYVDYIDVIGDKRGGTTTEFLTSRPESWFKNFNILRSFNLPIKVVYVIRNPYDNIATITLYASNPSRSVASLKRSNKSIEENDTLVKQNIQHYFAMHKAIVDAMTNYNLDVIVIHGKDLISDPKGTLLKICNNVGVPCFDDYLEICKNKIFSSESRTRLKIKWTDEQIQIIQQNIDKYSNLEGYSFDSS